MPFQFHALGYGSFAELFGMQEKALRERRAVRQRVTHRPGFPCRVSLIDAEVGEETMLVHYTHQPAASPFHAGHAIYVRRDAVQAEPMVGQVPAMLRTRLLSVRAFGKDDMMLQANVTEGSMLEAALEEMFAMDAVRYLHVHNAREGCYLTRVARVGRLECRRASL